MEKDQILVAVQEVEEALAQPGAGIFAIGLPDMEVKCNNFETTQLKRGTGTIKGFRVKSVSGRWYSIYLSALISDIPFSKSNDGKFYVIPDEFLFIIEKEKVKLAV